MSTESMWDKWILQNVEHAVEDQIKSASIGVYIF
jgi:hypothetical protein